MKSFRQPRTTQERRSCQQDSVIYDDGIYQVKGRAKRNNRRLPHTWEDLIRGDVDHRSWKRHRKHQYHGSTLV